MFSCCCTEEDDKELSLKPLGQGLAAFSHDQVQPDAAEKVDAVDDANETGLPLGVLGSKDDKEPEDTEPEPLPPPGQDIPQPEKAPENQPRIWDVVIPPGNDSLGIRLFVMPSTMAISYIGPGAVLTHNEANPGDAVEVNDFVLAVNGSSIVREMSQALSCKKVASLTIYRPIPVRTTIAKNGQLGTMINALPKHTMVHLQSIIKDASVWKHNEEVEKEAPEQVILVNDCVISVNGVQNDALKMAHKLQDPNVKTLDIVFVRPPPTS